MNKNWDWSFFDKIVYINLQSRSDRNEWMQQELEKVRVPKEKVFRFEAIKDRAGYIGCVKSHLAVLKMAQENDWENVLVLEDDMVFDNDEETIIRKNDFITKLKTTQWDVAFLSASYFTVNAIDDNFFKVKFAYLSNCYMVNKHYYDKLIDNFSESIRRLENCESSAEFGLDSHWMKLMEVDNWYGIFPVIGYQRSDISNIEHRHIDREHQFRKSIDKINVLHSK